MPTAPRISHIIFSPIAKYIFWWTIDIHFLDILIAFEILSGSSSIRTTSAASIAASDPIAPIAIPISALVSTGASFIPSPTNVTFSLSDFFCAISSSTFATLSEGRSYEYTTSIFKSDATFSATFFASPVSITVFVTPDFLSFSTASLEVGFSTSDITICPAYSPFIDT